MTSVSSNISTSSNSNISTVDASGYRVTDEFFGAPYIDVDEERDLPCPHRHIHGGFTGTSTRFTFYLPPDGVYQGRMYQPLEGGNAGHEDINAGPIGQAIGRVQMIFRLGGYAVESNMGHIGDVMDPKAGADPTIYGWRAAAESARFSKHVAAQVLGSAPHHSYVFGGSGGARRSPLCLAYAPDVWDGALPFMGDAMDGEHGDFRRLRGGGANFSSMFNVQRLLGDRIGGVIDAMLPGGSGDPFSGLDTHQREELANLYRLGFPRGDEQMIAQPMGQIWLWSSMAERLQRDYPDYWEAFWTKAGHIGFDAPHLLERDLIDVRTTVRRTWLAKDILESDEFSGPGDAALRGMVQLFAAMYDMWHVPMVIEFDEVPRGHVLGAGVSMVNGAAIGRQLYCINGRDAVFMCDGEGEASNQRFIGVEPGDEVHIDNRAFLAFCYYYRHHVMPHAEYQFLTVDSVPIYPQYELAEMSPFMGTCHSGRYEGKLMWVHHTHDSSLWPPQGIGMRDNVRRERGDAADDHFCLRWTENAEHGPPAIIAPGGSRASNTWLIDPNPAIEQSLLDLQDWVERDIVPVPTDFEYRDGLIVLPDDAQVRRGIQPVVSVRANGSPRAEVRVGDEVTLEVSAATYLGTIVSVAWDLDGSGTYGLRHDVDGSSASIKLSATHRFDTVGTHFVTALVESHRDGDVNATSRRIPNLASARVVVS